MGTSSRLYELLGIDLPIIQAPMAGANGSQMVIAVSEAGGLGSLPCAMLNVDEARSELGIIRQQTSKPFSVNFFCHAPAPADAKRDADWQEAMSIYYDELGIEREGVGAPVRAPFDEAMCEVLEEFRPRVVSFHFGLPNDALLARVKASGAVVLCSATTAKEARWLEAQGADVIIAQGYEAGGHRGMFLTDDISTQPGTMVLVPQIVDSVSVPVVAAGGIADARGVAAAFALGAQAVQVGTAYLKTPEATISQLHRDALGAASDDDTALTNIFSGRPARGIMNRVMRELGPISALAPAFPTAGGALAPLKAAAEQRGSGDFTSLWSGQAVALAEPSSARELTLRLGAGARRLADALNGDSEA